MSALWTILRREYLDRVRRRWFIVGTLLGPVFFLGITIVPAWLASRSTGRVIHLAVVDQTRSLQGILEQAFPDTLPDGTRRYRFAWEEAPADTIAARQLRDRLQSQVLGGEFSAILWLPVDALEGGSAALYAENLGDPEVPARVREAVSRSAMMQRLTQRGIVPTETEGIARRVSLKTYKITEAGAKEGGLETDFIGGFVFAMILYMTILLYGVSVQRSVQEDKSSRIVEIILSSTRALPLMLGKILGVGSVGLTQYAIWSLVAVAGTGYLRATNPALASVATLPASTLVFVVVYFILGYFLYAAIYAGVGAMVTSEQEAQQLQWPVTSLLIIPIVFMSSVMRDPDGLGSVILSLVPFFSPILMLMRINVHTPPAWQIGLSIVLLVLAILAAAMIAARIFRVGLLMYGKRPTLPEMVRWIRQA
jgi:ABC-2 type transport system permease protein